MLTMAARCSCSEYVLIPQYSTVEKLNSLKSGMTKQEVTNTLNLKPYEAYHSTENGCELFGYKYLHKYQEINPENVNAKGALRDNIGVYDDEGDAFAYFEDGILKDIIIASAEVDHEFVAELISACNGPISGCTDLEALNFNKDAVIDDNSCTYCPCNYYANPLYDENSDCEEQCLPIEEEEEEVEEENNSSSEENACTLCDVVQAANGQVNINIKSGGEISSNTGNINISNNDGSSKRNDNDKKKENNKKTKTNNETSSDNSNLKIQKQIDKLEEKLAKSEEKDSKKGVESKRTQLLRRSIELLEARL